MTPDAQRTFRASTRDLLWLPIVAVFAIVAGNITGHLVGVKNDFAFNWSICATALTMAAFGFISIRSVRINSIGLRTGSGHMIAWSKISKISYHPIPFGSARVQAGTWESAVVPPSILKDPEFERAIREFAPPGNPLLAVFDKY